MQNTLLQPRIRVSRAETSTCPSSSPPSALSCLNAINQGGCVRLGGWVGGVISALPSTGWINIKLEEHTNLDRQSQWAYPAGQLRVCWFVPTATTCCWQITCLHLILIFILLVSSQSASVAFSFQLLSGALLASTTASPVPPSVFILPSIPRHRVQLWPSQGAIAGAHLTGPWPQDDSQHQHVPYMRDKATQVSGPSDAGETLCALMVQPIDAQSLGEIAVGCIIVCLSLIWVKQQL